MGTVAPTLARDGFATPPPLPLPPPSDTSPHLSHDVDHSIQVVVGSPYEIDHFQLPLRTPAQLRSIRVAMLSENTHQTLALRFPSIESLKTYFHIYPELDAKFGVLVTPHEYAEKKHLVDFWLANSGTMENNACSSNKLGNLPSALKCNWIVVCWGTRRQVKFLEKHKEKASEPNDLASTVVEKENVLRDEARKKIGDTGLLDHLLQHMAGKVAPDGENPVRRRQIADGAVEYWLENAELVCAKELRQLKEEIMDLKRISQEMVPRKLFDEELAKLKRENEGLASNKMEKKVAEVLPDPVSISQKLLDLLANSLVPSESHIAKEPALQMYAQQLVVFFDLAKGIEGFWIELLLLLSLFLLWLMIRTSPPPPPPPPPQQPPVTPLHHLHLHHHHSNSLSIQLSCPL